MYVCTTFWLVLALFHEYIEVRNWGDNLKKNKKLSLKWRIFVFYKQHFFKKHFYQDKIGYYKSLFNRKITENHQLHLLKTDPESSSKIVWYFILTPELTTKNVKRKKGQLIFWITFLCVIFSKLVFSSFLAGACTVFYNLR